MRSQNGITLTSLVTYIILIFFVIAILATVTANFQSNIKEINQEGTNIAEIDKFNAYFLQEVKKQGNTVVNISEKKDSITFSSGNKYEANGDNINLIEIDENGEVSKTIKIAQNIESCEFEKEVANGKTIIITTIKVKNSEEIKNEYVLNGSRFTPEYEDEQEYVYSTNTLSIEENNI